MSHDKSDSDLMCHSGELKHRKDAHTGEFLVPNMELAGNVFAGVDASLEGPSLQVSTAEFLTDLK